jgi:hypothetical protein
MKSNQPLESSSEELFNGLTEFLADAPDAFPEYGRLENVHTDIMIFPATGRW